MREIKREIEVGKKSQREPEKDTERDGEREREREEGGGRMGINHSKLDETEERFIAEWRQKHLDTLLLFQR